MRLAVVIGAGLALAGCADDAPPRAPRRPAPVDEAALAPPAAWQGGGPRVAAPVVAAPPPAPVVDPRCDAARATRTRAEAALESWKGTHAAAYDKAAARSAALDAFLGAHCKRQNAAGIVVGTDPDDDERAVAYAVSLAICDVDAPAELRGDLTLRPGTAKNAGRFVGDWPAGPKRDLARLGRAMPPLVPDLPRGCER